MGKTKATQRALSPSEYIFVYSRSSNWFSWGAKAPVELGQFWVAVNMCVWVGMHIGEVSSFILYINDGMDPNNFCI